MVRAVILLSAVLLQVFHAVYSQGDISPWRYECQSGFCQKEPNTAGTNPTALSLATCRLLCDDSASVWPKPESIQIGQTLVKVNVNSIDVVSASDAPSVADLIQGAGQRFKNYVKALVPVGKPSVGGFSLTVTLQLANTKQRTMPLSTDEGYTLTVTQGTDGRINALIVANNFFGGRHGLETLMQLTVYDDLRNEVQMPNQVTVTDKPSYPHRGIMLDTARSFIDVASIKRTIEGMASSKMNILHWHITDTHSFPYVSESQPELSRLGAYAADKIYDRATIADIVQFARERGVIVMPEFDAPAHVGEGWQGPGMEGFVTCFDIKPWQDYCVEPPCGQLDPSQEGIYDVLEGIYKDMVSQFDLDIFHMGGDEVSFPCWNTTASVLDWLQAKQLGRDEAALMQLWDHFQTSALDRFDRHRVEKVPIIMWTSHLTYPEYVHYLPSDRYIVQVWTLGNDTMVQSLLQKGYRLILSNYDALYLDCGFAGWVADGLNWCAPYVGWQVTYENRPAVIAGANKNLIMGGETALWTEQSDGETVDARLWPRSAAWGERLWSDPEGGWREAEQRMLVQRERLVTLGISADRLQPDWCLQHQESCPNYGAHNSRAGLL